MSTTTPLPPSREFAGVRLVKALMHLIAAGAITGALLRGGRTSS